MTDMAANDLTGENMDATAPGEAVSPCQVMDCSPSTARAASVRQEASPGREDAPSWTGPAQEGPGSYTSSPDTGQLHAAIEKLHAAGGQEPVVARRGECRCPLTKELPSCVGSCGIGPQLGHHRLSAHIVDSFGLVAVPEDALLTQVAANVFIGFYTGTGTTAVFRIRILVTTFLYLDPDQGVGGTQKDE